MLIMREEQKGPEINDGGFWALRVSNDLDGSADVGKDQSGLLKSLVDKSLQRRRKISAMVPRVSEATAARMKRLSHN